MIVDPVTPVRGPFTLRPERTVPNNVEGRAWGQRLKPVNKRDCHKRFFIFHK